MSNPFLEGLERVYLDPKLNPNSSLCTLMWYSLATNAFGSIRLCCKSYVSIIENGKELSLLDKSADEIWRGEAFTDIRKKMSDGVLLPECDVCIQEEAGKKCMSKRLKENRKYFERYDELQLFPKPRYLSLNLGNRCNLMCRMCFSGLSNQILKETDELLSEPDNRKNFPEINLASHEVAKKSSTSSWIENTNFLSQIDYSNLDEVYITGGEPLLHSSMYDVLQGCLDHGKTDILLRVQTNLTKVNQKFIDMINQFERVQMVCSVDEINELANYVRYPSVWSEVERNFDYLCREFKTHIEMIAQVTVNTYNILQLDDILRWVKMKADANPGRVVSTWFNPVHRPFGLSITTLPMELKMLVVERLKALRPEYPNSQVTNQVEDLCRYIVEREAEEEHFQEFVRYTKMLDRKRGQNIVDFIPELSPYFK